MTLSAGNYIITGNLTNTGSGNLILGAGNYTIGGNFQSTGSSSLTLGSGLYIIGGNLQLTGSGSMAGSGITFYTRAHHSHGKRQHELISADFRNLQRGSRLPGAERFERNVHYRFRAATHQRHSLCSGCAINPDRSGSLNVSLDMIVDSITETGSGSITNTNYSVVTNPNSVLSRLALVE